MTMREYLHSSWPELLLVVVIATCMELQAMQCMHIAPELANSALLSAGASIVMILWLHLSARDRRSIVIGVPAFIVASVIIGLVLSGGDVGRLLYDSYDNPTLAYPVLWASSVLVFLLTRMRVTTILLGLGGCVFCGAVEFLYLQHLVAPTLVFACSCVALIACKRAQPANREELQAGFGISKLMSALLPASIAALASLGVFLLVVAPLNPPVHELKLIVKHYALEEVHVSGYADYLHQHNANVDSKNQEDDSQKTDKESEQTSKRQGESQQNGNDGAKSKSGGGIIPDNLGDPASLVSYFRQLWWLLVLIPFAIAVIWGSIVAIRRYLRRRRLERWRKLAPKERLLAQYRYLRSVFEGPCGVSAVGLTPNEYAQAALSQSEGLEHEGDSVSFGELSAVAQVAAYGEHEPSEPELAQAEDYIALVPKRLLRRFGRLRYLRLFFRV